MLAAEGSPLVASASIPATKPATVRVVVLSQFRLQGRDDPKPGEVIDLPRGFAMEMLHYRRVELAPEVVAEEVPAPKARKEK